MPFYFNDLTNDKFLLFLNELLTFVNYQCSYVPIFKSKNMIIVYQKCKVGMDQCLQILTIFHFILFLTYKSMNKRSKSQHLLKLTQENQQLLDKIERSKPLLTTIYDKVKRKQKLLYDRIFNNKKTISEFKHIANDYKKLYEDSIQIMQKGKLIEKFQNSPSNFIRTKPYQSGLNKQKSKSVYEQYKERIDRGLTISQEQKNPQLKALRKENQQLKNQMLQDIDRLRLVREKSQKRLRKAESSKIIKNPKQTKTTINQTEQKRKLVEKQREKLAKIQ